MLVQLFGFGVEKTIATQFQKKGNLNILTLYSLLGAVCQVCLSNYYSFCLVLVLL